MLENPKLDASHQFQVEDWGLVDYELAIQKQADLVDRVAREQARDTLVFCTHPPVVTFGRATQEEDIFGWQGPMIEVSRGGRATYHGPSQLVVYPIIDLSQRKRDLHWYLRALEKSIVSMLAEFGISAVGNPENVTDDPELQATGVWIGKRKIASIGIAVRKWVTYHGMAINVVDDPKAFTGIRPCGFAPGTPISMHEILKAPPDLKKIKASLTKHLMVQLAVVH